MKEDKVQDLADQLFDAQEERDDYVDKHSDIIQAFLDMDEGVNSLESMLKAAAQEAAEGYGEHEVADLGTHKLVVTVRPGNRKFDATELLASLPELAHWDGLLTVKASGFDAAVAAGMIPNQIATNVTDRADDRKVVSFVPNEDEDG